MWKQVFILVIVLNRAFARNCVININGGLHEPQPLILWPKSTQFVEPRDITGIINISSGTKIEFSGAEAECSSNGTFLIDSDSLAKLARAGYVCPKSKQLSRSSKRVHIFPNQIRLKSYPRPTARRTTRKCYGGASIIEIGFYLCHRFIKIMELCHDIIKGSTLYVRYSLSQANMGYQQNVKRKNFIASSFFRRLNVEHLYTNSGQLETFTHILGSRAIANRLVHTTGNAYLARGHLAAKTDFIYGVQQRATFYYVNVAPQWQQINSGNWLSIEDGLRKFIANRKISCEIITGTHDIMTTADINGRQRLLFLYSHKNETQIPVPKFLYKIAVDKKTRFGIALITVNNPYLTIGEISSSYLLCRDISSRINWLNWDRTNIRKGYSYACDVNDLRQKVRELPSLVVSKILV